jgi:serine/threonine protein kinase
VPVPRAAGEHGREGAVARGGTHGSGLDHANICTVFDIGDDGAGGLFIAMAFYEGQTLHSWLAGGRLPVANAVAVAMQVASGLESAHHAGVMHRDIKPSKVMWTARRAAKILDFGIAQLGAPTATGAHAGTPHYMSPEQVRGEPLDTRTDLWSLGVVLYQMLAGVLPFTGADTTKVLHDIVNRDPPHVDGQRSDIPPPLAVIVHRLLEKDPADRFQSPTELHAAFAAVPQASGHTRQVHGSSRGRLPAVHELRGPQPGAGEGGAA